MSTVIPDEIKELPDRMGIGRRGLALLVLVAAIAVIWSLSRWATAPVWVPVAPGMSVEVAGPVIEQLEGAGIPHRLERGGTLVKVRDSDLAQARVLLAQEGLPAAGRPGFELFDQPSWGMTDFAQRVNYRRALEGELERTIAQMRDVESAQVHLALQESSIFRRSQRPSAASVVLRLRAGVRSNAELVEGITYLVASSADGLDSENVTVLDHAGYLLSAAAESGSQVGLSSRQLAMQREIEQHLEAKAEGLVAGAVGSGNARVRVSATLSFDRVDRTVHTLEPESQVVTSEERSEVTPQPGTPGAGSRTSSATYETPRSVETFSSAGGQISRLTVAVLVNERVGSEPDAYEARTAEELARVEALVRNAVGIDDDRGDQITVVSAPFTLAEPVVGDNGAGGVGSWDLFALLQFLQRPALALFAIVLAYFLARQALRALRPRAVATGGMSARQEQLSEPGKEGMLPLPNQPFADMDLPGRDEALAVARSQPETAAKLIRAWIREG